MAKFSIFLVIVFFSIFGLVGGFIMPDTSQNASVGAMYSVFKSEIAKLNNQLTNFRIDFANIKADNDKLKATFHDLTTNYANLRTELTNASNENKNLEQEISTINTDMNRIEQEQVSMITEFGTVKQEFNTLGSQYKELVESYDNLTSSQGQGHSNSQGHSPNIIAPRVGFSVNTPDGTFSRDGALNFTKANYNDDDAFNFSSGQFECKVPGLYFFSSTLVREPGGYPESFCYLMINGHALAYLGGYGYNATIGHPSGTATMVTHMNYGDTVYVGMCGVISQIGEYSNLNGFLIDAD
ncbi:C1q and tumor necrosis factor protein 5 [Mactra antiquata]